MFKMNVNLRISVITPSYNSGNYIECAIKSVLEQNYQNFEHIIVDGGSSDGTLEVLKKYPHLKWVSGSDQGQSDAMNKGFILSSGEIIVYLNADDYFEEGAFHAVLPYFLKGAQFVVGQVRVIRDDGSSWINDPKVEFLEMLKWWQKDAFCFNPSGYFYRRVVQEVAGGFDIHNNATMDYDFLLKCAYRFEFVKIKHLLGNFRLVKGTKTASTAVEDLYTKKNAVSEKYTVFLDNKEFDKYMTEKNKNLKNIKSRIAVTQGLIDLKIHHRNKSYLLMISVFLKLIYWIPFYLLYLARRQM